MLNDLKNRGVQDVLFFCVDELLVFKEAMGAVYPDAQIQRCIIRMLYNSFKYVNYSDLKQFSSDFKSVYNDPVRCLPCQIWRKSWKNGESIPIRSAAGTITGKISAPSSNVPMTSDTSCIPRIS